MRVIQKGIIQNIKFYNKIYRERLEVREFDRWWRWIEYERGRVFQHDLFDEKKLIDEERIRKQWRDQDLKNHGVI